MQFQLTFNGMFQDFEKGIRKGFATNNMGRDVTELLTRPFKIRTYLSSRIEVRVTTPPYRIATEFR